MFKDFKLTLAVVRDAFTHFEYFFEGLKIISKLTLVAVKVVSFGVICFALFWLVKEFEVLRYITLLIVLFLFISLIGLLSKNDF